MMNEKNFGKYNEKRSFDLMQIEKLGTYVYALRDPRDGNIFYIGQGVDNRLFSHFEEAETVYKKEKTPSPKVARILDIWENGQSVDWFIVAHQLDASNVDSVESAALDALRFSNVEVLNENKAPHSSVLTQDDLLAISAPAINPENSFERVFIFSITNSLKEGKTPYEATRRGWKVSSKNQMTPAYAVGLKDSVSVSSYEIHSWSKIEEGSKYSEFTGVEFPELKGKNWASIVNQPKSSWQRGQYLIVEFDGKGKYRIIRGSAEKDTWLPL